MAGLVPPANVAVIPKPLFVILGPAGPHPGLGGGAGAGAAGYELGRLDAVATPAAQAERNLQKNQPPPTQAAVHSQPENERLIPTKPRREVAARPAPAMAKQRTAAVSEEGSANTAGKASDGEFARSAGVGAGQGIGSGAHGAGSAAMAYEQTLAAWLNSHKYYPASLRRRGIEGEGKLQIRISRSGHVLTVDVVSAFPHPSLEAISQDWVKRAEPFPRVPEAIPGDSYAFIVPVGFRLQ